MMFGERDIPQFFSAFGIEIKKEDKAFSVIFDQISENIGVSSSIFNSDKSSCYVKNEDIFDLDLKRNDVLTMEKTYKGKQYKTSYVIKNVVMDFTGISQLILQYETDNDENKLELENNGY